MNTIDVVLIFSLVVPFVGVVVGVALSRRRQNEFDNEFKKTKRDTRLH